MKLIAVPSFMMLLGLTSATRKIEPDLEPKSDAKFFGKDYPDDRRPQPIHKFGHPYPTVQDSDTYDKDYVEDENSDNGYFSAQLRYDNAKNKLLKERKDLAAALKALQKEAKEVEDAKKEEQEAEKHAMKKEADEDASDKKHDKLQEAVEDSKKDIDTAVEGIEAEVKDIEECKKQLLAARKKLKALLDEKIEYIKREKKRREEEEKAEADRIAKDKIEEELEKKIPEEEDEHEKALKTYKEEMEDVERVKKELKASAEKLAKFRHADPDGGVYEVAKGAAWKSSELSGLALLFAALFFA